jgi:hypothetical protein
MIAGLKGSGSDLEFLDQMVEVELVVSHLFLKILLF